MDTAYEAVTSTLHLKNKTSYTATSTTTGMLPDTILIKANTNIKSITVPPTTTNTCMVVFYFINSCMIYLMCKQCMCKINVHNMQRSNVLKCART
jgi:hypothetical protein